MGPDKFHDHEGLIFAAALCGETLWRNDESLLLVSVPADVFTPIVQLSLCGSPGVNCIPFGESSRRGA